MEFGNIYRCFGARALEFHIAKQVLLESPATFTNIWTLKVNFYLCLWIER